MYIRVVDSDGEIWIVRDPILGDNGKSRVVDEESEDERVAAVARFQGGDNAGHSMVVGGKRIAVHVIPSGVVRNVERPVMSVMGRGMVFNPTRAFAEMDSLAKQGVPVTPEGLLISEGAQMTLAYHMALELARESGSKKMDTTARAISQTYGFARFYQGVRAGNIRNLDLVRELIQTPLTWTNAILTKAYDREEVSEDEVMAEIEGCRERLIPFLGNEILVLNDFLDQGKVVLCEGAQSGLLDPDIGIYPNTTASNTWPGAIQSGCGLDPSRITRDIVVIKAYVTRVGIGGLVAEILGALADLIRDRGDEFGVSSGRARRIAWLELLVAELNTRVGPGTELVINKIDVLHDIDPLQICTGYRRNGELVKIFPTLVEELNECEPIMQEFPGFTGDIKGVTSWDDLPEAAQKYLAAIAEPFGIPVSMIGTGPGRGEMIKFDVPRVLDA